MPRSVKRFIIILIFLGILFLVGWLAYSKMKPAKTCDDGKQNQNETGIDCGGICQKQCEKKFDAKDLRIEESAFVPAGPGTYDVMARVSNPNNQLGSPSFSYEFSLKDAGGNVLAKKSGTSFILPVESKYIIETGIELKQNPQSVEVSISNQKWEEFFGYERPELNIYNKRYNLISSGVGYSEAKGLLRNESSFDFDTIRINIVLRDENGKPVAFNKTEMKTVNVGAERDFRLLWPIDFPGSVQGAPEMEAETNVFDSQNFIKKYIQGSQSFQTSK
ncbi:MAG: hypothetical protein WC906_05330 [Parcubacteria group bacterium]|jgi:hypothetical protein